MENNELVKGNSIGNINDYFNKSNELVSNNGFEFVFNVIAFLGLIIMAHGINNFFNAKKEHNQITHSLKKVSSLKKTYSLLEIIGGAMFIGIKGIYLLFN